MSALSSSMQLSPSREVAMSSSPNVVQRAAALGRKVAGALSFVAPLLGGVIASAANYETVFAIAVLFSAASLGMLIWGVREPRHEKRAEVEAFEPASAVHDEL